MTAAETLGDYEGLESQEGRCTLRREDSGEACCQSQMTFDAVQASFADSQCSDYS